MLCISILLLFVFFFLFCLSSVHFPTCFLKSLVSPVISSTPFTCVISLCLHSPITLLCISTPWFHSLFVRSSIFFRLSSRVVVAVFSQFSVVPGFPSLVCFLGFVFECSFGNGYQALPRLLFKINSLFSFYLLGLRLCLHLGPPSSPPPTHDSFGVLSSAFE